MGWEIVYYSEEVQQAIVTFPAGIQARYVHLTQRLVEFGPNLGMPHTRSLGKGLFELRMTSKEGIGRVFFCTLARQRILMLHAFMMLHAFIKKTLKTPVRELRKARSRLTEVQGHDDAQ